MVTLVEWLPYSIIQHVFGLNISEFFLHIRNKPKVLIGDMCH